MSTLFYFIAVVMLNQAFPSRLVIAGVAGNCLVLLWRFLFT